MNVTLSLDARLVERARKRAEALGKSLNQVIREHLERLAGEDDVRSTIEEMRRLSERPRGDRRGWKFDRNEIHER